GAAPTAGGAASPTTSGGGYVVSGNWKGYAWTGATGMGSTIMPMNFAGLAAGAPFCVMGSVAADPMYGVGMLGVNLNQAATMDAPLMTATPTGSGVMVDITNNMASTTLRIQIQTPDGDADHRWCAPVSGKGGMMPWSAFNTKCWDNSGTTYAGEPI